MGCEERNVQWYFPAPHYDVAIPLIPACPDATLANEMVVLMDDSTAPFAAGLLNAYVLNGYMDGFWKRQMADCNNIYILHVCRCFLYPNGPTQRGGNCDAPLDF
ncbi:hypothetical protein TraAM80_02847 [Trypanosoma rangeli]|uniref:Uncharacterized protein n=1 Tax=Trypanosoma rangeli TaxID=5698 RepID=A0A3R7KIR3_TRYRA|nr:uncharacterized protein TraAM80_02847 [Trypanosoma rangeli]RNF08387.1 hypothetical protein TraAM80_02847 [Trypanosoma rangeli]|eukprot:RNF08387.1 hypothetical protein TraAM80_02847 [Trypanosoma rangeli]